MGEHQEEAASFLDSVLEKVTDKLPGHDSSSSDSDDEKSKKPEPSSISSSEERLFGREKPVHSLLGGGKCKMFFLDSVLEKVTDKLPGQDSSSSDSDDEKFKKPEPSSIASSEERLFGREKPVHSLLGGGKSADVILWRNKQTSAGVLVRATVICLLLEWFGYAVILGLTILLVWSNASAFINKEPVRIPRISFSEQLFQDLASAVIFEISRLFSVIHDAAFGRDFKKYLLVVAGLWILSVVGSWAKFLAHFYVAFVLARTGPVLYEKYADQVDAFAFKAMDEAKKSIYRTSDVKVLSKIPRSLLKDKKF